MAQPYINDQLDALLRQMTGRLAHHSRLDAALPPLPAAPEPPPDDEPISGDYGEPVEAPMAAYLAQFAPLPPLDPWAEARRQFEAGVRAGTWPPNATWQVGRLYSFIEAEAEARAQANAAREALPEWPIDWRTFRD